MSVGFLGAELARWDSILREAGPRPSVLGLPFFEDERPLRGAAGLCDWRLGGRLSALLGANGPAGPGGGARLHGAFGERLLMPTGPRLPWTRLLLFGLGNSLQFDEAIARRAARQLVLALKGAVPARAASAGRAGREPQTLALVAPGRSTGALSARQATGILLDEASTILDPSEHRLVIVESAAGQKEAAELARRFAGSDVGPSTAI